MTIEYFGHPFSSYTWKGEVALIEKGADYLFRPIDGENHPENVAALKSIWPLGKFPALRHGDVTLFESSILIEYVDTLYPDAPPLIPHEPALALRARWMDRVFDNHVMTPVQAIVAEHLPFLTPAPDAARVERARDALRQVYAWLEGQIAADGWVCGADFSMADCAAAPALFYADWVERIPTDAPKLRALRARLLARPSVAQVVERARPYRHYFPLSAPDRD